MKFQSSTTTTTLDHIPKPLHGKYRELALTLGLSYEELFARLIERGMVELVRDLNAFQCFQIPQESKETIEKGEGQG